MNENEKTVGGLSDTFYAKKCQAFRVKLDSSGFTVQRETSGTVKTQVVKMPDIVGARTARMSKKSRFDVSTCSCTSLYTHTPSQVESTEFNNDRDDDECAYLYIFAYSLKKTLRYPLRRERTVLVLRFRSFDLFEENMVEAEKWYNMLKCYKIGINRNFLSSGDKQDKRLLILLNPKAGMGKAREMFNRYVCPILNEAELHYDLQTTKCSNYACDYIANRNIKMWSGIVAAGGDGIFFEILNGLLKRPDWEEAMNIPLGILPSGSGNGLARSIAYAHNEPFDPKPIIGATLAIVSGKTSQMDVVRIELKNQVLFSFLSVGWGLISDIDVESERLRSLGYQRFTLWTLHRLIRLRTCHGKISYLEKTNYDINAITNLSINEHSFPKRCKSFNRDLKSSQNSQPYKSADYIGDSIYDDVLSSDTCYPSCRSRCDSWYSVGSHKSSYYSVSESVYHSITDDVVSQASNIEHLDYICHQQHKMLNNEYPSIDDPTPDNWIVEEGNFIMVHAVYQTHLGSDCFFSPQSKLNDGTIFLFIIRSGISRSQLLSFLMSMSSGAHFSIKSNFIKIVPVTAFRLEPYDRQGIMTVDGERVPFGTLQGTMVPGIAKVMVPN